MDLQYLLGDQRQAKDLLREGPLEDGLAQERWAKGDTVIRLTEEQGRTLLELVAPVMRRAAQDPAEAMLQEIGRIVEMQLNGAGHFDDLIDVIVKMVQEPRVNSLNRDHLRLLRGAILSPLELAKFKAMQGKLGDCTACGRKLHSYEAVTYVNSGLYCYRCAHPEYVTCGNCEQIVGVDGVRKTIDRALARHTCPTTPRPPQPEDDPVELAFDSETAPTPTSRFRTMAIPQRIVTNEARRLQEEARLYWGPISGGGGGGQTGSGGGNG